jgi:hypothetical protein
MTDAIRIGLVVFGMVAVGICLAQFMAKRDRDREVNTTPEAEAQRARDIALDIGTLAVTLIQVGAGLVLGGALMVLFVGLLIGMATPKLALELIVCAALSFPIYLWAARVARQLV